MLEFCIAGLAKIKKLGAWQPRTSSIKVRGYFFKIILIKIATLSYKSIFSVYF